MTDREFFISTLEEELPRFERVFRALPGNNLDWRPHEKNRSAMEIVAGMTVEAETFPMLLTTGEIDFSKLQRSDSKVVEELWILFKQAFEQAKNLAEGMTESDWNSPAKIFRSGTPMRRESTKGKSTWGMLHDLIHHRGQLSVYIRPMGGKVPSIYGPSGDNPPPV